MSDQGTFARAWKKLMGRGGTDRVPSPPAKPAPQRAKHGIERRRLPRVRVLSSLQGYDVELDVKVVVREVSVGGFSAESPVAFTVGSEHTFLFAIDDGRETMVRCECRHARQSQATGALACIAGFRFLSNQEESLQIITDLYKRLRARYPALRDEL